MTDVYVKHFLFVNVSVPGYISRSVAGSYDNEGIAIFALQFTYFLWVGQCLKLSYLETLHF